MKVWYLLNQGNVDGLTAQLATRKLCKTAESLKAWRAAFFDWCAEHEDGLAQFDPREIAFDLGSAWPVQIIVDHPTFNYDNLSVDPDSRVEEWQDNTPRLLVGRIQAAEIAFERLPGDVGDPRGHYRHPTIPHVYAFVRVHNGRYQADIEVHITSDANPRTLVTEAMDVISHMAFEIIRGALQPTDRCTHVGEHS